MADMMSAQSRKDDAAALRCGSAGRPAGRLAMNGQTRKVVSIACAVCIAVVAVSGAASAQPQKPPQQSGPVTALVIMTPNRPATWMQWRSPGANPQDKAAIEYWVEGYLSGLAAGSHHDAIGQFRRDALAGWLDRYCAANPQIKLPLAVNALGREMLNHPRGQL
jgi:hypothetical protein